MNDAIEWNAVPLHAHVLPLRSKCDYINTLCTWHYRSCPFLSLSPSLSLSLPFSRSDYFHGSWLRGRRDPFVIYHERADSRDTQRYACPNEQWKLPWTEGNNRWSYVHACNRDHVLELAVQLRPINHFCIGVRFLQPV